MSIAIDAMGGDLYPRNPVLGAVKAVREKNISIILVGDEPAIKRELEGCRYNRGKVEIVHTSQVVGMNEPIATAMRSKRDSSMRICYDLHKKGDADGVVSAGNSGAMLAIGRFVLRMIPGIDRPCISALLPSLKWKKKILLVDAGANMDCTPENLLQFGILGNIYMQYIHSIKDPRVGLLNVGSETGKGDELTKAAYKLLQNTNMNFVGNVEGKEFFDGDLDIVVTDGFAGNVLLKSVQGAANFVTKALKQEVEKSLLYKIGAIFMRQAFAELRKRTHYAEFGGAPLLGLRGNAIVCHGASNPDALFFGINFADWAAKTCLVERMEKKVLEHRDVLCQT